MKKMVSDQVKAGVERAPHRSLFFAAGLSRGDMKKPFIGICNSYESFVPGHCHLNKVGEFLKKCVIEAGGVPMEFNTRARTASTRSSACRTATRSCPACSSAPCA